MSGPGGIYTVHAGSLTAVQILRVTFLPIAGMLKRMMIIMTMILLKLFATTADGISLTFMKSVMALKLLKHLIMSVHLNIHQAQGFHLQP